MRRVARGSRPRRRALPFFATTHPPSPVVAFFTILTPGEGGDTAHDVAGLDALRHRSYLAYLPSTRGTDAADGVARLDVLRHRAASPSSFAVATPPRGIISTGGGRFPTRPERTGRTMRTARSSCEPSTLRLTPSTKSPYHEPIRSWSSSGKGGCPRPRRVTVRLSVFPIKTTTLLGLVLTTRYTSGYPRI